MPPRKGWLSAAVVAATALGIVPGLGGADAVAQERARCAEADTQAVTNFIIDGTPVRQGDYPWQVSIGFLGASWGDTRFHHCGGAIIGANWVLTAAHCLVGEQGVAAPRDLIVRYGNVDLLDAQTVAVDRVLPHPSYSHGKLGQSDIGLLRLARPIPDHTGRKLWFAREDGRLGLLEPGVCARASGWGATGFQRGTFRRSFPQILQETTLPIVDIRACQQAYAGAVAIDPKQHICAGFARGGTATCSGDSGGALVVRFGPARWQLLGVVSFGKRSDTDPRVCALENGYPVFTRVAGFHDWIIDTVQKNQPR